MSLSKIRDGLNFLESCPVRLFQGTSLDRPPRCERCGELESDCSCPPPAMEWKSPNTQTAKLSVEKRRKGKVVTVIQGLAAHETNLPELLTRLKSACGAGGSQQEGALEIQGRQLEKVRDLLTKIGYRVKG